MQENQLLDDIDHLYQAALKPALFVDAVDLVGQRLGVSASSLSYIDTQSGHMHIAKSVVAPEDQAHYFAHYYADDPLMKLAMSFNTNPIHNSSDFVSQDLVRETKSYQEFFKHYGMYHYLGIQLGKSEQEQIVMHFTRPESDTAFNQQQKNYLATLIPHIRNAHQVNQRFRRAEHANHSIFDYFTQLDAPMFALTLDMRVVECNAAAEQLLQSKLLRVKNTHFLMHDPLAQKQLFAILQGFKHDHPQYLRNRSVLYGQYQIKLMLLPSDAISSRSIGQKIVIAVFEAAETQAQQINRLSRLHALTKKETYIVASLVQGLSVQQISDSAKVTIGAIRFHLKNVFAKTQTHSQKELVLLFLKKAQAA